MADILPINASRNVLDKGHVALLDLMPRICPTGRNADWAVARAARTSYGKGLETRTVAEDRTLIRYLMRHKHTGPFEQVELQFYCCLPIFVARQWIRHRTASVNEVSGRYSELQFRYYRPAVVCMQSSHNKQGSGDAVSPELAAQCHEYFDRTEGQHETYESLIKAGVSKEIARIGLPVSLYTEWYWKTDLHNFLHFLHLRMAPEAQAEIRVYAEAMHDIVQPVAPAVFEAWHDYCFEAVTLSRLEIAALRTGILDSTNEREVAEWQEKRRRIYP